MAHRAVLTVHRARFRGAAAVFALLCLFADGAGGAGRRVFPDTSSRIGVLTDQLPGGMTAAQIRFAATHYVGSQKLTLDLSRPLRAINPDFIVLHYRLAMWQSAPRVNVTSSTEIGGERLPAVDPHESWFWHNPAGQRVASNQDGKLLMNIADPGFRAYWRESIANQVAAGDYDGVFLDSASPALLQWEARAPLDPRLLGSGVRTNRFPELGGSSWIAAWQDWMADLDASLAARGIPLIPNVGALATTWDNTDYSLTAGAFCEGFLDPGLSEDDWHAAANQTLDLVRKNRIVILQNYLSPENVSKRKYLLANYLLVKGTRTYVVYFATALDWYPEWTLELGAARTSAATVNDLYWKGVYRRDFANGIALVNPGTNLVRVDLGATFRRVDPVGGGAIGPDGIARGTLTTAAVSSIQLPPKSAEILLR